MSEQSRMESASPSQLKLTLEAEVATRRGPSHECNEDAYFIDLAQGVFVVADGMGGHRDGHLASNAIISEISAVQSSDVELEDRVRLLTSALEEVNGTLYSQSLALPGGDISGSTALCLLINSGYACCLWAGDSRLYLLRDNHLFLVSEDHTEESGMLTRAIGSAQDVEIDRRVLSIKEDDVFVLCSDGLLKGASEDELAEMLSQDEVGLADRLLAKSIVGGSKDDITLILVWVRSHDI
ncbi:PP2C family protein-serine/threonine phosphatase [Roseibium polysiphoniae]|uniref:Serine/threonine-protein phosphatase n=1 Tax=Roseibium polysiphoniae TaxID=2571221 RepID=A0ABR9C9X3_9HYPH|nr:protein phosphatase 2C domain-containing protein [Roseibium polysiphoniae]MBD8876706.1 serine/threonine-protein phosphatase [Roseibium polysiphoniae]